MNIYKCSDGVIKLKNAKVSIDDLYNQALKQLRKKQQWWIPARYFKDEKVQNYINEFDWNCFWWIGRHRSKEDDKILCENRPWDKYSLIDYLLSRPWWRWFDVDKKFDAKRVLEIFEDFDTDRDSELENDEVISYPSDT